MPESRPNVILIMADQFRGDCLGCDGNPVIQTPNLDWLAARGTRFNHAYSAVPSCLPARATLMTGQNQWHAGLLGMGRGQRRVPNDYPHTLAGELSKAGYRTHLVGKGHFDPQRAMMGFQSHELDESGRVESPDFECEYRRWFKEQTAGKDVTPDDHGVHWNSWLARPWHTDEYLHPTSWTMIRSLEFLKHRDKSMPFFLNISFARPHSPYVPPETYFDMYLHDTPPPKPSVGPWADMHDDPETAADPDAWHGRMSDYQVHRARAGYYGDISFIDTQIARLMYYLSRFERDAYRNTLFIFTSDHGDMTGDHNMWRKTYAYEGSARIPFIVKTPDNWDAKQRDVADEVVELRDVMPTILDACGVEAPETMDGKSVLGVTREADPEWREYIHGEHCWCYSGDQEMQYVTDGRRKFVWLPRRDQQQFFDLEADPGEAADLIDDPARQEEIAQWRGYLVDELTKRECGWTRDGQLVSPPPDEPLVSPWRDKRRNGRD